MESYHFKLRTDLFSGQGSVKELVSIIKKERFTRVAVIIDKAVKDNKDILSVFEELKKELSVFDVFVSDVVEPTYDFLDSFKKEFIGKGYGCIIGIGGGSIIDVAKGIATLLKNEGPALSYRGFPELENRPLPVIAIPTTAGTGSEATFNAAFIDSKEKRKLGINSQYNYPLYAILDPNLVMSCPKKIIASSGMDALVHALESYICRQANILSKSYSQEAIRLIINNLSKVIEKPEDVGAWSKLQLGAYLAGIALMNGGGGIACVMSYPLGVHFRVPHGVAGAVFLPHAVEHNVNHGFDYSELYDLIDGADKNLSKGEKSKEFSKKIFELYDKLELPSSLSAFNVNKDNIAILLEETEKLEKGLLQNPVPFSVEDGKNMLKSLLKGE